MEASEFSHNIKPELLQIVEWNREPRWVRFVDGKKRLIKPGDHMLVVQVEDTLEVVEKIKLH